MLLTITYRRLNPLRLSTRTRSCSNWIAASALLLLFLCGCEIIPRKVSFSDPEVQPFLQAMSQVDRQSLGFTPVEPNSTIHLEIAHHAAYDAMLHVYGTTSRTVAFRKIPTGYRWIGEQEIYTGPGWEQTVDGTFREQIVVEFQTERVNGIPTNQLSIHYTGSNSNLVNRENLTLEKIRPILSTWKTAPPEPKPPDLPGMGFAPAPAMFVLMMLLMLLAASLLAILVLAGVLVLTTILVVMGVISAAVFTGVVKRSVSAGFRALCLLVSATGGFVFGMLGAWGLTISGFTSSGMLQQLAIGGVIGTSIGLVAGCAVNLVWTRAADWLVKTVKANSKSPPAVLP